FRLENGGNARHKAGIIVEKLHLVGPDSTGNGIFVYNDQDDVMLDSLLIEHFDIGVYVGTSNDTDPGSNGLNERITLRRSVIQHNPNQGYLGGAVDLTIEDSRF